MGRPRGVYLAAWSGHIDILEFVIKQGEVIDAGLMTEALNCAGSHNQLQTAQWLRERDAQWPAELGYNRFGEQFIWSDDMIAWARAEGCTAPAMQL
jgi:hypothetical protein